MLVIIHRVNSIEQLDNVPQKYGVEIDVRAMEKRLILNHDPFEDGADLEEYLKHFSHRFIMFHLKETGIQDKIIEHTKKFGIQDYFFLDVEYPLMYDIIRLKKFKKFGIRFSESLPIEYALAHEGLVEWVYIDTTTTLPLDKNLYTRLKNAGFKICLVCPSTIGRQEDVSGYKEYMKKNGIQIDAIMTELENAEKWEE